MSNLIIEKFGGQNALARLLNKKQSTIQHWSKTNRIPAKWQPVILKLAEDHNIDLSPSDFISAVNEGEESVEKTPIATHRGILRIGTSELPCYVLQGGARVFSLKGVVTSLIETDGGQLAEYIKVKSIRNYLPDDLKPTDGTDHIPALIKFDTGGENFSKYAIGVPVEKFIDICSAYSAAFQDSLINPELKLTERQREIAISANKFLRATAKVGIIALVDEATGYQYDRPIDALEFKLNLFLEKEMREWDKTFPDQLWSEFGRLTNWNGAAHKRPKYWGKLVNELVYSYLDKDVYTWLKSNAPKPIGNLSYHRWLSSQFGLKKLIEHLWQLVGMASACNTMEELRKKMAEKYGRIPVQITMYFPPDSPKKN